MLPIIVYPSALVNETVFTARIEKGRLKTIPDFTASLCSLSFNALQFF